MTALDCIQRHAHLLGEVAWRTITVDDTIHDVSRAHYDLVRETMARHWASEQPEAPFILEIASYAHTTGYALKEAMSANVTLFDISAKLLAQGRSIAGYPEDTENPRLVAGDFHDLPFENQSFDFVFICSSLHHTWEWKTVLRELQRVLAPGGLLLLEQEPCRRSLCFYNFRADRVHEFTPFEKKLDELGVIRTFAEPSLGSRPESLFNIVENLEIPLDDLLAAVDSETEIVDARFIPEDCMSDLDRSWVEKAHLDHATLSGVIEKDLKKARKIALEHLDPVSRGLGFRLPECEDIEAFARAAGVRLAALPPPSSGFRFKKALADAFGAALRIVAQKPGKRERPAIGALRRPCSRENGVFYGFRPDVSRILMDQHSLIPDIQTADEAVLDSFFPSDHWSRAVADNGLVSLKLSSQTGFLRLPDFSGEAILILRFCGGPPDEGPATVSVLYEGGEVYSFELWKCESFLAVIRLESHDPAGEHRVDIRYSPAGRGATAEPLGGALALAHAGLYTPQREQDIHSPSTGGSPHLSVVINTLNEEANIEDCLKSVQQIADEIVLVDMYSDDRTVEIARRYTDRIFFHERTGVVEPAREAAIQQAKGNWILILDADERVSPELAAGIRKVIANPRGVDVFCIPRRNYIAGRWMRGTGFGIEAERQPRLFRQGSLRWPERIHAYPVILGTEAPLPLPDEARIDHLAYRDLHQFMDRVNRYTDHEARILDEDQAAWSPGRMLFEAKDEFIRRYDPEADGIHSLVLAMSMAFYRFLSWAKLWERRAYPGAALPTAPSELFLPFADLETDESQRSDTESRGEHSPDGIVTLCKGFYEDEGGWCWMSGEGKLRVPSSALPGELRFSLTCDNSRYYEHFPFLVQIAAGRRFREKVLFDTSDQQRDIFIPLEGSASDVHIRIQSQEVFVPAYLGLNRDRRRLSIRLSNPAFRCARSAKSKAANKPESEHSEPAGSPSETSHAASENLCGSATRPTDCDGL